MTGRTVAQTLKKRQTHTEDDRKIEAAVAAYIAQQELPSEERKGSQQIAQEFGGCGYRTILHRAKGKLSMTSFNAAKQKLSTSQENVLADFLVQSAGRGFGRTHSQVYEEATAIYVANGGNSNKPLGKNWVDRFLERHHEKLQTHWTKPLDTQRANALNPATTHHWFYNIIKPNIVDKDVPPELLFGMDESGFPQANTGRQRVIGARGTKTQHASSSGDCENITAIVTICADGTALRPTIIYKGKNLQRQWTENNIAQALYVI
jgi:hypothetical protein